MRALEQPSLIPLDLQRVIRLTEVSLEGVQSTDAERITYMATTKDCIQNVLSGG